MKSLLKDNIFCKILHKVGLNMSVTIKLKISIPHKNSKRYSLSISINKNFSNMFVSIANSVKHRSQDWFWNSGSQKIYI